jgi:hypothetical protein
MAQGWEGAVKEALNKSPVAWPDVHAATRKIVSLTVSLPAIPIHSVLPSTCKILQLYAQ